MAEQIRLPEGRTQRDLEIALKNKRTAVTVFQFSWIMVFVCLAAVNMLIRSRFETWPPDGVAQLDRILPTLATIGLIVSAWTAARSVRAIRSDERPAFFTYWQVTLLLGFLFLVVMIIQWVTADIDNQYGAIFRVMVGYHALHAIVIGIIMWRVLRTAHAGGYTPQDHFGVEGSARLWYFVVAAWVLFYIVLYVI